MTKQRFKRYLLDGGMWFEEYIEPVWSIHDQKYDTIPGTSPIQFLQFEDNYKDLCDEVVNFLNDLWEEREELKELGKTVTAQREKVYKHHKWVEDLHSYLPNQSDESIIEYCLSYTLQSLRNGENMDRFKW